MNPFDPNFKGQIPPLTKRERGHAKAARKMSAHMQALLDQHGPSKHVTQAQRTEASAKTAKLRKVSI